MTKQQLLALLREAYSVGVSDAYDELRGSGNTAVESSFIAEIERTNKVGGIELPEFNENKCEHDYTPGYDHGRCRKCGWIFTDGGWGIAKRMWFKNLDYAKFYQKHGRLPQQPDSD